jgi:DNA topoisomerase-3
MERGKLSRAAFMEEIRQLTSDIVTKVRGGMGKEVRGEFHALEVKCPRCGGGPFKESFRAFECEGCKLTIWKTMAGRELERDEVTALLRDRRVGPLEGFRSKMGRSFNAVIIMSEDWKQKFDFEKDEANGEGEALVFTNPEPIALCPVCKEGKVYETASNYVCEQTATKKCNFRMGKMILQRAIPREQVAKLATAGKTDLLPRFISKKNRPFSAFLVLGEKGKVEFEFEKRAPKKAAAPKAKRPAKVAAGEPAPE